MDTKQIVSSILRTVETELTEFFEGQSHISCPVEYEKRLIDLSRSYARSILEQSQGKEPKSRNSKKSLDQSG